MEKRAIIAVALSIIVLVFWTYFLAPKTVTKPEQQPAQQEEKVAGVPTPESQSGKPTEPSGGAARIDAQAPRPTAVTGDKAGEIVVENATARYRFSELGGRLTSVRLKGIRESRRKEDGLKELIKVADTRAAPLGLTTLKGSLAGLEVAVFESDSPQEEISVTNEAKEIRFRWVSTDGMEVTKTYSIRSAGYLVGLTIEVVNHSGRTVDDNLVLLLNAKHEPKEGGRYAFKGFGAYADGRLTEEDPKDLRKEPKVVSGRELAWGGYENSYFLQALIPLDGKGSYKGELLEGQAEGDEPVVSVRHNTLPFSLAPGTKQEWSYEAYFGPKRIEVLKKSGHKLETSINMGWFDVVAKPFLYFLNFTQSVVKNFGVAIILLTIGVKIVFFPLTQKSYKSMRAMQQVQPQMAKLKEKYGGDRQKFNQEMMALYRAHKVNPMGGCLPMVIQIPVFIALYRLLDYAIELRHAPFFLWIQDLSAPDRLFSFPFSVPLMEPPYGIPVLTLLMGASMFITQKMTPTPGDPTQAKVMLMMPVIFTFVFINFPSGLVLYWLTNNVLQIGQQLYVNRGLKKS